MRDLRQHAKHVVVELARIGLSGHAVKGRIPHLGDDLAFQLLYLFAVALEQIEEARLRARRALDAAQFHAVFEIDQRDVVHLQIFEPKRRTLANGRQLRGLKVSEAQRRQIFVFERECLQFVHHVDQLCQHEIERAVNDDHLRIVGHKARRRAQMNDRHRLGRQFAERLDVRHDVVTHLFLELRGIFVVDVVLELFHLGDLLVGDVQSEFLFRFGKRDPQPSPKTELRVVRKVRRHLFAGVSCDQGIDVNIGLHSYLRVLIRLLYNILRRNATVLSSD